MLIVKLIVVFVYITNSSVCSVNYCEICPSHTLCLYSSPGANYACKFYDDNALLTEGEIEEIVNTINERRNFIAMGLSIFLPQAANMKKIMWSPDLAVSAQRWVDQCDSATQPDKEDQCRDLGHTKVGQNIATVFGPTPGLHIKSFVELWFIPILKYRGNISYYNQSKVHGTDYFTQLIWAETEFVGCGKARFYVSQRNTLVERLVCNFAPKGNVHGKPIYALGYPSTQCPGNMIPDKKFQGMCTKQKGETAQKLSTTHLPVTSLLRILNLSNTSVKQDIDPLRGYFKQNNVNNNITDERRNQKMRHVFFNNTYGGDKRIPSLDSRNFWSMSVNNSRKHNIPVEKGHSRVYHGYESYSNNHEFHTQSYDSLGSTQMNNNENFGRYDFTRVTIRTDTGNNLRKPYGSRLCTRKQFHITQKKCESKDGPTDICTRGEKCSVCAQSTTLCPTACNENIDCNLNEKPLQSSQCVCLTTICPPNPKCKCNANCNCLNTEMPCENIKSTDASPSLNYNFSTYILLRSGNKKLTSENSSPLPWLLSSNTIHKSFESSNKRRQYEENYRQVKNVRAYPKLKHDAHYYDSYYDSSERKKRESEHQITLKPFWQMDEFNHKKPELKSVRYTTLGIRKNRKSRRTTYPKTTESITITSKEISTNHSHRDRVTEKYLSFEELMHLRKITATEGESDARRKGVNNILRQGTTAADTRRLQKLLQNTLPTLLLFEKNIVLVNKHVRGLPLQ